MPSKIRIPSDTGNSIRRLIGQRHLSELGPAQGLRVFVGRPHLASALMYKGPRELVAPRLCICGRTHQDKVGNTVHTAPFRGNPEAFGDRVFKDECGALIANRFCRDCGSPVFTISPWTPEENLQQEGEPQLHFAGGSKASRKGWFPESPVGFLIGIASSAAKALILISEL